MSNFYTKNLYMPMPSNISYWWNFGALLGICLTIQLSTGLLLSMFYENSVISSFDSISQISRNMNLGWMMRSMHANGASFFFIFIYMHIGRSLMFKSFSNLNKVWFSGFTILMLLFATAFLGYVLPWGQMSFWGATVITSLLSSFPYFGQTMTTWLWGSFSVSKPTLMRFFSLHFILPLIMTSMVLIHIIFLHEKGSNNPLGLNSNYDKIPFYPFFIWKDLLTVWLFMMIFLILCNIFPFIFMDPDNFIMANPLSTPPHIQPEWYFLFAYAILRTIPNKLGGVLMLFMSIFILMTLPFIKSIKMHLNNETMTFKIFYFTWLMNFLFLTLMGAAPIEEPFMETSMFSSLVYFIFFLSYL
ncbi:cytochrome b (mitochondrion) [Galendromus occidentalis]|uniref:Cytochrome b n=1 Tax=Galendromus occidentalis TaxID=34638 RepID=A3RE60_9ACAR|nr:cytochrome b [Galendromus occidentalis]YP_001096005.1 cytochrome b [Galendromus occidentalis]ABN45829.1 cytochrome b [Galendromus occidentalis]ABN45840.1 cytochrome b [Galendromus occidentalis]